MPASSSGWNPCLLFGFRYLLPELSPVCAVSMVSLFGPCYSLSFPSVFFSLGSISFSVFTLSCIASLNRRQFLTESLFKFGIGCDAAYFCLSLSQLSSFFVLFSWLSLSLLPMLHLGLAVSICCTPFWSPGHFYRSRVLNLELDVRLRSGFFLRLESSCKFGFRGCLRDLPSLFLLS